MEKILTPKMQGIHSTNLDKIISEDLKNSWHEKLILSLFFLFPVLTATLKDAGSTIYILLGLLSFFYCRKGIELLSPKEKRLFLGFIVFFGVACLSLLMTEDLHVGIQRLARYGRLLLLIPIYLMCRTHPIEIVKTFLIGAFTAAFAMLGQALYQVEVSGQPLAHGAYHKIIFGNMAVFFTILIVIGVFHYGKQKLHYIFVMIAVLAGLYAALLSGSRSGWLLLPFIAISLMWLYRRRLGKKVRMRIVLAIGLTCLSITVIQPVRLVQGIEQGWTDLKTFSPESNGTSLGIRLVMWRNSLLIFKESPLVGTGVGDFRHDSRILLEKGLSYKNNFAMNQKNAHNLYFMLLAEGGLLGLTLLMVVFFVFPYKFFYEFWQRSDDKDLHFYALLGLITVFAFAWFGVSESWVNRNPMMNAYCMAMLIFMSSAANRADELAAGKHQMGTCLTPND